jgi:hypothetical protein
MPSKDDLEGILDYRHGERVAAGYEVLLHHWRILKQRMGAGVSTDRPWDRGSDRIRARRPNHRTLGVVKR